MRLGRPADKTADKKWQTNTGSFLGDRRSRQTADLQSLPADSNLETLWRRPARSQTISPDSSRLIVVVRMQERDVKIPRVDRAGSGAEGMIFGQPRRNRPPAHSEI